MKNKQLLQSVIFISIFLISSIASANSKTISIRLGSETGQDVLVTSNFPNTNLNGHPDYLVTVWTVSLEEYIARSYFQFYLNQIPSGASIVNAKLSLFANPTPVNQSHSQLGGPNTSYLYRVQTEWDERTMTWNTQPEYTTLHKVTIPPTDNPNQDYPDLDVTDMVRDMVSHPTESYGFMIVTNTEWFFWYRAMNFAPSTVTDTLKRPLLEITYIDDDPISINNGQPNGIPDNFSLSQNYPNPFNPTTRITYDMPVSGNVTISLFDINGREVRKLVNEFKTAGYHSVDFNGFELSSGTYFYEIITGDFRDAKRMVLLK